MNLYPTIRKFQGEDPKFYAQRCLNPKSQRLVDQLLSLNLKGIWLELHGRRLCVCGYTYHHREKLMSLGFKWEHSSKYWYSRMTFNMVESEAI